MVNAKEFFSGNFLKAEDCKGGELVEILDGGSVDEIKSPEGEMKSVLNFQVSIDGVEKTFTPNKANGNLFIESWGEDTQNWKGKKFQISLVKINVFGKMKNSIVANPLDKKI